MGTQAAIYTNDQCRDIIFPVLRSTTASKETDTELQLVRARTKDTIVGCARLRHDRGPEFTGSRKMGKIDVGK